MPLPVSVEYNKNKKMTPVMKNDRGVYLVQKGGILMIRFRNPVSDINVFIENFKKMYY